LGALDWQRCILIWLLFSAAKRAGNIELVSIRLAMTIDKGADSEQNEV
jgi:hypothetical protein